MLDQAKTTGALKTAKDIKEVSLSFLSVIFK